MEKGKTLTLPFHLAESLALQGGDECGIGECSMETDKVSPTYTLKLFI